MRLPYSIILFITACLTTFANETLGGHISFRHLGLNEGLSHTTVPSITQDSLGYMWFATYDGLNRYDGYTFKVYRHNDSIPGSISSDIVRQVITDFEGNVWAASENELSLYDRTDDSFKHFSVGPAEGYSIEAVIPINRDTLATTGNNQLSLFDKNTEEFINLEVPAGFRGTALASKGNLLIAGSEEGSLVSKSLEDNSLHVFRLPIKTRINAIMVDKDEAWIGTEGAGLYIYNLSSKRLQRYTTDDSSGLGSNFVRSLKRDKTGRIWAGTFQGLSILDPETNTFTNYTSTQESSKGLSQSSVRSIYIDSQDGIWAGTFFGGLNYFHPLENQFRTLQHDYSGPSLNDNVVSCIEEGKDGKLYIGTNNGGVNIYNPHNGDFKQYTIANGLTSNDVKAIYISDKHAYIGVHTGRMCIVNLTKGSVNEIKSSPQNVFAITEADGNKLWLGTLNGLVLYDPEANTFQHIDSDTKGIAIHPNSVTNLFKDNKGRLWLYGDEGFNAYVPDGSRLRKSNITDKLQSISNINTSVIYQNSEDNTIWIGTRNGLYRYDENNGNLRHFTTEDGLANNIVYGILITGNGEIWISTNGGLSTLDPKTMTFRNYSTKDGLPSNQFNVGSSCLASNGSIYFGGVNGITYFNPTELQLNPFSPKPLFTGLKLFNTYISPGDGSGILKKSIDQTESITFGADQSMFTVEFSVCNYIAGEHNTFAYNLDGQDEDWYFTDDIRSVTYHNLPAGKYTFMVKAANNDGVWSEPTMLSITVRPKWYNTWWAALLFIGFVILGVYLAIRYKWHKKSIRQQLEFERKDKQRLHEIDDMKVRFFINMSHELRTPLTLILLPITELIDKINDPTTLAKLKTVRNNAQRMLNIVNLTLDYRKAEMGMFKLSVSPTDVYSIIKRVFDIYEREAVRKNITYKLDSTIGDSPLLCDSKYLDLMVNNLISNAFKYTAAGGSINVSISRDGDYLHIEVRDTGCGIPADKLDVIFDRFYQVNDTKGGSGIGLSLVKNLCDKHHGTISVKSQPGQGTSFLISLPVSEKAYSKDEIIENRMLDNEPVDKTINDSMLIPDSYETIDNQEDVSQKDKERTIMVVDDNTEIVRYLTDSLNKDYRVLQAYDGAEGLNILASENIDLVITDVMMPDIDGIQLCRAIKRNIRTSHIPVIMLSAKGDVADQLDGMKVGADDYLPKPFSMQLLMAKIRNQFRTRDMAIRNYSNSSAIEPEKVAGNPLDEKFLKDAMEIMEKHLDDSQFTTDEFARSMCMSRSSLHMKMKALTGESTNEFIRRIRMNKALDLLKSGNYNVSEVSSMVGYSTPSYFAITFKKFYGSQPSDFINKGNTHSL